MGLWQINIDRDDCEFGCMPMDHGEEPEPDMSRGMYQEMPMGPVDYGKLRERIAEMPIGEQIAATQRYIESRYVKAIGPNEPPPAPAGPAAYCVRCARSGVGVCDDYPDCPAGRREQEQRNYTDMIRRATDGSDPLVPEPKSAPPS